MPDRAAEKRKSISRRQVGALPVRRSESGALEVLLVTGRRTGRWVIPKGWPSRRLNDAAAAAREAMEEAGVSGNLSSQSIGSYTYAKSKPRKVIEIEVEVYLLAVETVSPNWEEEERARAWFPATMAAALVHEPALSLLIREHLLEPREPA
jgi:8-oxo-dGTP pyrophosphatase MutT (NUDIX family)